MDRDGCCQGHATFVPDEVLAEDQLAQTTVRSHGGCQCPTASVANDVAVDNEAQQR